MSAETSSRQSVTAFSSGLPFQHERDVRQQARQVIYQEVTTSVTALAADRRTRLDAVGEGVPPFLWAALIGGGVLTIGFTFLFGLSNTWVHIAMVGMLAAVIVISLILISDLNYPFAGPGKVGPDAFEVFLSRLPPPR